MVRGLLVQGVGNCVCECQCRGLGVQHAVCQVRLQHIGQETVCTVCRDRAWLTGLG